MDWTFRIGQFRQIEVYVHWFHPLWMVLLFLNWVHPHYEPEIIAYAAVTLTVVYLAIVFLHEYGHCWMARRLGGYADRIVLWPLGGLAMVQARNTPRDEILVAAAGPAVNVLIGTVLATAIVPLLGWAALNPFGNPFADPQAFAWLYELNVVTRWSIYMLRGVYFANAYLLVFNLIPCYPLDGGRILLGLIGLRLPFDRATRIATTIAMGIAIAMAMAGFFLASFTLVLVAVFAFLMAYQQRRAFELGAYYYDDGTASWGEDSFSSAESWRAEGGEGRIVPSTRVRRSGPIRRWLDRRRRVKARRAREAKARMRTNVEEILEKISRDGMGSLTSTERRFLDEASAHYHGPPHL